MIKEYRITLLSQQAGCNVSMAYPLYAWLLSRLPREVGDALHHQAIHPLNQYVIWNAPMQQGEWVIHLLTDEMVRVFSPVLDDIDEIALRSGMLRAKVRQTVEIPDLQTMRKQGAGWNDTRLFTMYFLTPTTFKQEKRYVIYPQEQLILQSLIYRWNLCFPETPLHDEDAFQALLRGIHIVDYQLHTTRYPMKQTRVPAFQGRISIEMRLSAPLMALWTTLYSFAPYAGIGVKTTLGMGGIGIMQGGMKQTIDGRNG